MWQSNNQSLSRSSVWWCSGEPNNSGGNSNFVSEGCIQMVGGPCFNDISCNNAYPFVCEKN